MSLLRGFRGWHALDTSNHPIREVKPDSIVEVEWTDSERVTLGWAVREDYLAALADRTTYRTVGYVVEVTADYLLLVMNRSDSGMVGEGMVIPIVCITAAEVWPQ